MKKKIVLIATLLLSILSVANTKDDYTNALQKYAKDKDVSEFEMSLKNLASQSSDEYTRKANITLATIKLQQNKLKDAEYYASKVVNDKNASNTQKELAYKVIYNANATNPTKKLDTINKLISINSDNIEYQINQIADNLLSGNKSTADSLYSKYTKNLYLDDQAIFNGNLAQNLIDKGLLSDAQKYALKDLNLNLKVGKITGDYYLAIISQRQNKLKDALNYALDADKISKGTDVNIKKLLINLYELSGDKDNAINQAIALKDISPTSETYFNIIMLAEKYNKTDIVNDVINELKSVISPQDAANLDRKLALAFLNSQRPDIAAKYANKLINNKDYLGYLILAKLAILNGNKAEALKQVGLAKQYNVDGASDLEREILSMN